MSQALLPLRYFTRCLSTSPFVTNRAESESSSSSSTHFGFRNVDVNEKEKLVRGVFSSVADSYDVMNDLMSGGIHRCWKDQFVARSSITSLAKIVRQHPQLGASSDRTPCLRILDVAGGTGDIAFRFLEAANCVERAKSSGDDEVSVTVVDINPEMLRVGEQRAYKRFGRDAAAAMMSNRALTFREGNAQSLPCFQDNTFDIYTIAFGLRNVTDVDAAIREAYRVLKPGGRYMCLEFSRVNNAALGALYDLYSFHAIPKIGKLVAGDEESYQYLVESIRKFSCQLELAARLQTAGFHMVSYTNFTGGIVAIHEGWKPL